MRRLFFLSIFLAASVAEARPTALIKAAPHAPTKKPLLASHPVELVTLNTHQTLTLRPDGKGRFPKEQLRAFNELLRCHHTGKKHAMAPRLAEMLYTTAKHFDYRRIVIVAGYRAPKIARQKGNPKSPHKRGVAADFRIEGIANTTVRDYVRTLARVGVGYYPNSGFIHLDVDRQKNAFWIDESGPGERARYVGDPEAALEVEREFIAENATSPREELFDKEAKGELPAGTNAAVVAGADDGETPAPRPLPRLPEGAAVTSPPEKSPWGSPPQPKPDSATEPGGSPPPGSPSGT